MISKLLIIFSLLQLYQSFSIVDQRPVQSKTFTKSASPSSKRLSSHVYEINDVTSHAFDGIGAISGGGATSRLLVNYPEPQRSEVLDYLFKPNFGASLQIFKVEIGGDGQSTEGTEPSHMHYEDDENYNRGYEWWLMEEAVKRNPNITLIGLPWTFPGWVGDGSCIPYENRTRTADYVVSWVRGARDHHNLTINYVGVWNERPYDKEYIKTLRVMLDKAGFKSVGIIAADGSQFVTVSHAINHDPELAKAVSVIGAHYTGTLSGRVAQQTGKPLWSSEDYSTYNDGVGAGCLARLLNQNYVNGNMTATIIWNIISSYYDDLPFTRSSLMTANEPWSGHYEVTDPLWAAAHTTQFTRPGWKYLTGSTFLEKGGSLVALSDENGEDLTVVLETMSHDASVCVRPPLPTYEVDEQEVVLKLIGAKFKAVKKLNVWWSQLGSKSTEAQVFQNKGSIDVNDDGTVSILVPVDSLVTLTTLTSGVKGSFKQPSPASSAFPFPYADDFDGGEKTVGFSEANNFADQSGSFEFFTNHSSVDGHKNTLRQVVTQRPITWCDDPASAITVVGDYNWTTSLNVSISMKGESSSGVFVALRVDKGGCDAREAKGIFFWLMKNSYWMITEDINRTQMKKRCMEDWQGCWKSSKYYLNNWNDVQLSISPDNHFYAYLNKQLVHDFKISASVPKNGWVALGTASYGHAQFDDFKVTKF